MNEVITKKPALATGKNWLTPRPFLICAVVSGALFLLVHLAGLREYTAFLSGTPVAAATGMKTSAVYGMVYILFYLGFVVVAPILVLAAGILAAWQKFIRSR